MQDTGLQEPHPTGKYSSEFCWNEAMQGKNLSPAYFSPSSKDSYGLNCMRQLLHGMWKCLENCAEQEGSIPCMCEEDPAGCMTAFCQEKCTVGFNSLEAV